MRVVFQIDPLASLHPERDTSVLLIKEALNRGFDVYAYEPCQLSLDNGTLRAVAASLKADTSSPLGILSTEAVPLDLNAVDIIWVRQDPPFNMAYITATYLLDHATHPVVFNSVRGLRECPEKLAATHFSKWMPPTLVTSQLPEALAFQKDYGEVIIKPLYEFGGRFIAKASTPQELETIFAAETLRNPLLPLMIQRFLPAVVNGDKRIFMIDGEVIGCFTKLPEGHAYLSNLAFGGRTIRAVLSEREEALCQDLSPFLKEKGLFFVGLDVIDGYLTEINVTSPTGIPALNRLYGRKFEADLWDKALMQMQVHKRTLI